MTNYEIATLVVSSIAILLSIIALFVGYFANRSSKSQGKTSTLNNIFINIDSARARMEDHIAQMATLSSKQNLNEDETKQLDILNSILDSKIEGLLNAYDDGCQRYLAKDVIETTFREKYIHSIKDLVEQYSEKFQYPVTRFKNIVTVYKDWYS